MVRAWASHYPVTHADGPQQRTTSWRGFPTIGRDDETRERRVRQDLRGVLAQRLRPQAGGDRRPRAHAVHAGPPGGGAAQRLRPPGDVAHRRGLRQRRGAPGPGPRSRPPAAGPGLRHRAAHPARAQRHARPRGAPLPPGRGAAALARGGQRRHPRAPAAESPSSTPTSLPSPRSGCPADSALPSDVAEPGARSRALHASWPSTSWRCCTPRCPPSSRRPPSPSRTWTSSSGTRTSRTSSSGTTSTPARCPPWAPTWARCWCDTWAGSGYLARSWRRLRSLVTASGFPSSGPTATCVQPVAAGLLPHPALPRGRAPPRPLKVPPYRDGGLRSSGKRSSGGRSSAPGRSTPEAVPASSTMVPASLCPEGGGVTGLSEQAARARRHTTRREGGAWSLSPGLRSTSPR